MPDKAWKSSNRLRCPRCGRRHPNRREFEECRAGAGEAPTEETTTTPKRRAGGRPNQVRGDKQAAQIAILLHHGHAPKRVAKILDVGIKRVKEVQRQLA